MGVDTDSLKIVMDMAVEKGRKEQECVSIQADLNKAFAKIEKLEQQMEQERQARVEAERKLAEVEEQNRQLVLLMNQDVGDSQESLNNKGVVKYIVLSVEKLKRYLQTLDDNGRIAVAHLLMNAIHSGVIKYHLELILKLTALRDKKLLSDLAESMKKLSAKPSMNVEKADTVNNIPNVGNYNEKVMEQRNDFPLPPINGRINKQLEAKDDE